MFGLLLVGASAVAAPPGTEVELLRGGRRVELSPAARAYFATELPRLFSTCSVNSRLHPKAFAKSSAGARLQEAQAGDHLAVRLTVARNVGHPLEAEIRASELIVGLAHHRRYPGPFLSRDGSSVVAHAKCAGGDIIRFVCAAEVKTLMPAGYHQNCDLLK